ncbi:MAG: ABC transporter [Betaproteobacteria bacterium]|nr:ABC transporter [Betaproteobacteria bacterium]
MKANKKLRLQSLLQNSSFAVLAIAIAVLVVYVLKDSKIEWDITQNKRNSLTQPTVDVLKKIKGAIQVTAYATPQDAALGDLQRQIKEFIAAYQRIKPGIVLSFVDPREQPKETAEAGVRSNGELVIEYEKRRQHLTNFTESEMANVLMRLVRNKERLVMFVDGHGERKLNGQANHDLGEFGRQIGNKGFRVNSVNLAIAPEVPDNAAVLVITQPQVEYLAGEVEKLQRYLEKGGALLWLLDQEPLHGLQPIADLLSLNLTPGIVVDPDAAALRIQPTVSISSNYGMHAITTNFQLNSAFPFARAIATNAEDKTWRFSPLVEVSPRGWLESNTQSKAYTFDEKRDVHGPIVIAGALERNVKEKKQRVVVVGTGHFLANIYLGSGGNLDLGINMLNWLTDDEGLITVQPREKVDSQLSMNQTQLGFLGLSFLVFIPVSFLAAGGMIWWRRRKA